MHPDVIHCREPLPPDFVRRFGLRTFPGRTLVSLWWCPVYNQPAWDDGMWHLWGKCDVALYLSVLGHRSPHRIARWLHQIGGDLGTPGRTGAHCLVLSLGTLAVWLAPIKVAALIVRAQDIHAGSQLEGQS